MYTDSRLKALREELDRRNLAALLVTQDANRRYLSGFTGDAGALLITPSAASLLTDFRYVEQAQKQAPGFELDRITADLAKALPPLVERLGLKSLAFEADATTVTQLEGWRKELPGIELQPTTGIVLGLRRSKDAGELDAIRQTVALTDRAYAHVSSWIRPGMTELEVAWEIEVFIRTHGGEGLAFPTIVASGPNGSLPHAQPGDRVIQAGESVTIDMGAKVRGYCSDLTRTFCIGSMDARFEEIYSTVFSAQAEAEKGIKAGLTGVDADAIARKVIEAAGYGPQFGHSLGHGVGLVVHEEPRLSRLSSDMLAVGDVVTVEPGIYIPGWGGIRIEDTVVVTETGIEILTRSAKDPVLPLR